MLFGNKLAAAETKIAQLTAQIATLEAAATELAALKGSIQLKDTELATAQATAAAWSGGLAAMNIKLGDGAAITADAVKAAIDAHVSRQAAQIVASTGHEPLEVATGSDAPKTAKELREEFEKIGDPNARAAFYTKHRAKLLG